MSVRAPSSPLKRQLGSPALFGIVQGFIAASIYFSTGLVAERALGLTWAVFLAGGVLFALIVRTLVATVDGVAIGLVLGVLFIAAGAGRLYVERRL